jgi:hypothetical protein
MSLPFMRKLNPFKPTDIGGCQLWLDSTDSSTVSFSSGSNVSQWRDKSGSSNHFSLTNGTTSYISDNGMSVINFPSGAIMSSANQITFTTLSAFYIVSRINAITGTNNIGMLLGFTNINGGDKSIRLYVSGTIGISLLGTAGVGDGNELANNNYFVNGSFNPSFGSNVYLNVYSIIGTVAPQSGGTSFLTLSSSFLSRFFIGNIAEFIYYPAGITNRQREQIEGYLAQKWGLQGSLPAGTPGRTGVIYPRNLLIDSLTTGQPTRKPFIRSLRISIITPGSLFHLDAGNPASYPGSGSTWTDLAGSGLTTTLFNTPTYSSANGGYLSFAPASSQYGQTSASFATQSVWSVEVWHYYTNTNNGPFSCILTEVWNNTPINFTLGCVSGSTSSLQAAYFNSIWYATTGSYSLPSVGWYHIVGTYDGTNIKLYVNNVLTQTQASTVTPARSNLGIRFMRRWDTGDYWGGRLAIIRIYNRALLASEVTTNYEASKGRFGLL